MTTGCTVIPDNKSIVTTKQSPKARADKLKQLQQWSIQGKIAFIDEKNSHSATLNWQVDEIANNQAVNLTTYLGINVLQVTSKNSHHTIKFDGEVYETDDLSSFLQSLTGLTLPTQVLTYWLKGLPYQDSDIIVYSKDSTLPSRLLSTYDATRWEVTYADYQQVDEYTLATTFAIRKENLLIKIALNSWSIPPSN